MKKTLLILLITMATCTPRQAQQQGAIIFTHEEQGNSGIYVMGTKDAKPTFLTHGDLPSPSPDGHSFAYVFPDSRNETNRGIRIMDLATGTSRQLVGLNACYPRWSPSGDKLLFECYSDKFQIWIVDTNGRNLKQLLNDAMNPAWSPDGRSFAFIRDYDLFTCELTTGKEQRITQTEEREKFPAWSPDGNYIAMRTSFDKYAIELIELASGRKDTMASCSTLDHISWTPQGNLLYDDRDTAGNPIIMLIDPLTKIKSPFNKKQSNGYWPEWIDR